MLLTSGPKSHQNWCGVILEIARHTNVGWMLVSQGRPDLRIHIHTHTYFVIIIFLLTSRVISKNEWATVESTIDHLRFKPQLLNITPKGPKRNIVRTAFLVLNFASKHSPLSVISLSRGANE